MAADDTGDWGQPNFLASGAPEVDVDPSEVADYFARITARRFANWAALVAAGAPPADGYMARVDTIPGAFFLRQSGAWVMHGVARFTDATARAAAITAPATGMLSRLDSERFVRRYSGTNWRPYGAGLFPIIPTSVAGSGVTLGADGAVAAAASTAISMMGIGSADFDTIRIRAVGAGTAAANVTLRVRTGGADVSGANYSHLAVESTLSSGPARTPQTNDTAGGAARIDNGQGTFWLEITNLFAATATTWEGTSVDAAATRRDVSGRHSLATSYPDLTILIGSGNFTGKFRVFGYNNNDV